jgi:hypothetical protein
MADCSLRVAPGPEVHGARSFTLMADSSRRFRRTFRIRGMKRDSPTFVNSPGDYTSMLGENIPAEGGVVGVLTLALVNVKLRHEFHFSFLLYTLPRVELPIAMLT